jgi:glycolate oxidase iron-sulfur subunit
MRAFQDGRLPLEDTPVRHIDLCLGCRACEAVCPSGVQYGALLEDTRQHVEKNYRRSAWQRFLRRFAIEQIFPFPERLDLALWPVRIVKQLKIEWLLPGSLRDALALVPRERNFGELPVFSPSAIQPPRGRVGFIVGCVMPVLFGATNKATVRLLNRAGYDVVIPREQSCCGALYAHIGNLDAARACARRNVSAFERAGLDAVIINAAGCGSTLKEYGHLLKDDPLWAARGAAFSATVKDLTEWLYQVSFASSVPPIRKTLPGSVTFHDACHLAHAQRITRQPRELVRAVAGANFVELLEADVCCGSAGSYNLTEPEMAGRLQRRKVENVLKTGAEIVVTTNPGCLLQIRAGLKHASAQNVHVLHIADFLDHYAGVSS